MLQLKVEHCTRAQAEEVSDVLFDTGALSVSFTDLYDTPILEPEIGTTPLWEDVVVEAIYEAQATLDIACIQLSVQFQNLSWSIHEVPEKDWVRETLENFKPQKFGERLWVSPSSTFHSTPGTVTVQLSPGLAFGTGTHPTTALCLTWLEQAALSGKTVIDFGCGSGILAIAALKLGAAYADAVDIDEQALTATENNAKANHIGSSELRVSLPDTLTHQADILVANILMQPLLNLRDRFSALLKSGGTLVITGLLRDQEAKILDAYHPLFTHQSSVHKGDWLLMVFKPEKRS